MNIFKDLYDRGDFCLRTSLYYAAKLLNNTVTKDDELYYKTMMSECWLNKIIWNRKSAIYKWSNSGSETPSENTLTKRPTKWIYEHILKYFSIDLFKGLNGDQYRSYILTLYLQGAWRGALKLKAGFLLRLGFTPSMCEYAPFKPQAYVLLFKIKYPYNINLLWYPIYLICKLFFYMSYKKELNISIFESTTNKISMLPTAHLLGLELPKKEYINLVYDTYFKDNIVGKTMKEVLCQYSTK